VERQQAATDDIARNVEQAAGGTREVAANIAGVCTAIEQANRAAGEVHREAGALSDESTVLNGQVDAFIARVRAA
jgi:methyl-accepting chemotaxis protein